MDNNNNENDDKYNFDRYDLLLLSAWCSCYWSCWATHLDIWVVSPIQVSCTVVDDAIHMFFFEIRKKLEPHFSLGSSAYARRTDGRMGEQTTSQNSVQCTTLEGAATLVETTFII